MKVNVTISLLVVLLAAMILPAQNMSDSFLVDSSGALFVPPDLSGDVSVSTMQSTVGSMGATNGLVFFQLSSSAGFASVIELRSVRWPSGVDRWRIDTLGLPFAFNTAEFTVGPDLNGDGEQEILVAVANAVPNSVPTPRVFLLDGSSGSVLQTLDQPAGSSGRFGSGITSLGDIDGDGFPEFALSDSNRMFLYSYRFGAFALAGSIANASINPPMATTVLEAGSRRLARVSAFAAFASPQVDIFALSGLSLTLERSFSLGPLRGAATSMGDLDGDGTTDWVGGTSNVLEFAAVSGSSGSVLWRSSGFVPAVPGTSMQPASFGFSLQVNCGDYDGDGRDDIALGDPSMTLTDSSRTNRRNEGGCLILSGRTGELLGAIYGLQDEERVAAGIVPMPSEGGGGRSGILVAHPNSALVADVSAPRRVRFSAYYRGVMPFSNASDHLSITRCNGDLVLHGARPGSTLFFVVSRAISVSQGLRTVDLSPAQFVLLLPLPVGVDRSVRLQLPVGMSLPELQVQFVDERSMLSPATSIAL